MAIEEKDTSARMSAGQERKREESVEVGGQWLLRQGELVLGPISGEQVLEKLHAGEVTGETPVARPGERTFQRLVDTDTFRLHVVKAEARVRVEAQLRAERERAKKVKLIAGGVLAGVTVVLGLGAWQVARYLAVHGGSDAASDDITMDPPTITLAQARGEEEALLEYPGGPGKGSAPKRPSEGTPKPTAVAARPERPTGSPGRRTGTVHTDADGLATHVQFDQEAINRVVAQQQRTLHRCFKEEVARRPDLVAKVPIEFTIGNDGKVAQLWIDHPFLQKGPLHDCLLSELRKWPFQPFKGERPSVGLSFNVGRRG